MSDGPVRVAVVDDHPVFRAAVAGAVEAAGSATVTIRAGSLEECERALDRDPDPPAVVVLDLRLPGTSGIEAVARLAGRGLGVLVLSADADEVVAAFSAGARGYLVKSAEADEIRAAALAVARGDTVIAPELTPFLVHAVRRGPVAVAPVLTARERQVLALVADGRTDQQIAAALVIGLPTVRSHLDHIREKTGHRRRADLTRLAVAEGLVPDRQR